MIRHMTFPNMSRKITLCECRVHTVHSEEGHRALHCHPPVVVTVVTVVTV